jgi:hypothetical protein
VAKDFYTFSDKILSGNPEIWYGVAAVVGWLLLVRLVRFLWADKTERRAMLTSCGSMAVFLLLFVVAVSGFAAAFTFLPGR